MSYKLKKSLFHQKTFTRFDILNVNLVYLWTSHLKLPLSSHIRSYIYILSFHRRRVDWLKFRGGKQKARLLIDAGGADTPQSVSPDRGTKKNQSDFKVWKGTFYTEHFFASVETYEVLMPIHYTSMHLYTPLLSRVQMKTVYSEYCSPELSASFLLQIQEIFTVHQILFMTDSFYLSEKTFSPSSFRKAAAYVFFMC